MEIHKLDIDDETINMTLSFSEAAFIKKVLASLLSSDFYDTDDDTLGLHRGFEQIEDLTST